ncbi:hypothetical protein MHYP_G00096420 [Metynnis hypsauchen]
MGLPSKLSSGPLKMVKGPLLKGGENSSFLFSHSSDSNMFRQTHCEWNPTPLDWISPLVRHVSVRADTCIAVRSQAARFNLSAAEVVIATGLLLHRVGKHDTRSE